MIRNLHVVVLPAALSGPWKLSPADLLRDIRADLTWIGPSCPLEAQGRPEVVGRALSFELSLEENPALLWLDSAPPGWLARMLRASGVGAVVLVPLAGADLAGLAAALRQIGLACEERPLDRRVRALARNIALFEAMPTLLDLAQQAGVPVEREFLAAAVRRASWRLAEPWPAEPEVFAAELWPHLADKPVLPALPVFDPMADGPAGLTGKRITFVIEKLADRSGGAERVLIETANALAARGHTVEIVSHEFRGKPPFYPTAPGVRLANLRPRRESRPRLRRLLDRGRGLLENWLPDIFPFDRLVWLSRNGGFYRRLARHLAVTRPDAAIAFMPPAVTALALADPGVPVRRIASMHNAPVQDFENPERWDPSRLDRRRRKAAMARIDVIGVLLDEYRDWYPSALQDRIRVVPNAVTPVDPHLLATAQRGPVVLAVGRLAAVKRHGLLIEAWRRIVERFPEWELRIFGEGPLRETLETQVAEAGLEGSVRLMGHTSDIAQEYLAASILAHPAEFEGFPLAVTEALAAGLPVVGFDDCSGLNRLVADGLNGQLVPAAGLGPEKRTQAFADALAALMADTEARRALSAGAPGSVAQYAPDLVVDMWEDMIFGPKGGTAKEDDVHG